MQDDGVDWDNVKEDIARLILQQGETFMQAQLQAAIAADGRATAMSGLYVTLALAVLAGGLGYWAEQGNVEAFWSALVGGALLIVASAFAAYAARPVTFYFPGNQPSQWFAGRRNNLVGMIGGEAENYDERIAFNEERISASKRAIDRALITAVIAPVAALLAAVAVRLF